MQTPEFSSPAGADSNRVAELERSLASLRGMLTATLVILLVGAIGINVLLFRNVRDASAAADELEKRFGPMSAQYDTVLKPRISAFLNELVNFANANPDYRPILQKYPIASAPATPAAAAPAPVAPVAPKK